MEEEKREEEGRKEIWILHLKGVIKVERICVGGETVGPRKQRNNGSKWWKENGT